MAAMAREIIGAVYLRKRACAWQTRAMPTAQIKRPRGRPRDPDIEPRVYAAALDVYSERGWHGFSLEAVGRAAGVGQAALYRRWSNKEEVLAKAVAWAEVPWPHIDSGESREDLLAVGRHLLRSYRTPNGVVGLRMMLDARTNPGLADLFTSRLADASADEVKGIVRRVMQRGDLRPPASVGSALQILIGGTLSHVLLNPTTTSADTLSAADERFLRRLVGSLVS